MRGRRVEVTKELIDRLVEAIAIGGTYALAAAWAGISKDTLERLRRRAETAKPGTALAELRDRMRQAEGQAAMRWLAMIEKAGREGEWRACAFMLERRYPETYGRRFSKVAMTSADGQGVPQLTVIGLPSKSPSPEQWQQDVEAVREQGHGAVHGVPRAS